MVPPLMPHSVCGGLPNDTYTPLHATRKKLSEVRLTNRDLRTGTDVGALKKSLESVGLIHPVTINGEGELLAGARRFQAASELGWGETPVQVVELEQQELLELAQQVDRVVMV